MTAPGTCDIFTSEEPEGRIWYGCGLCGQGGARTAGELEAHWRLDHDIYTVVMPS